MGVTSIVAAGRRLVATTLLDRAVRQEQVTTRDGIGGSWSGWQDVGPKVPVRFGALSEADSAGRSVRPAAGQLDGAPGGIMLAPLDSKFAENDRVRDVRTGRIWVILGELTAPSTLAVVRRLYIREA